MFYSHDVCFVIMLISVKQFLGKMVSKNNQMYFLYIIQVKHICRVQFSLKKPIHNDEEFSISFITTFVLHTFYLPLKYYKLSFRYSAYCQFSKNIVVFIHNYKRKTITINVSFSYLKKCFVLRVLYRVASYLVVCIPPFDIFLFPFKLSLRNCQIIIAIKSFKS